MKISSLFILFAFGVLFSSCSKKTEDVSPTNGSATTAAGFRVKIDGSDYNPDFSYALATMPGKNAYYAIYGLDSKTSDVVAMALPATAGEGTHPIDNVNFGMLTYNKEDFSTINGGSGTITITKKTATNLVGTFSFTAVDATGLKKRTLTEGTFNVTIRE
ncbi:MULTISPECIES: DUF6252 family protein [unclassified Spirosoma]|uniref:DUF6252 family protein n=1 Tax=unclassified Spirosoma TaxID=2621999 RepID=UPI000962E195|nr:MULTISPECIES: DUF6252 family protein [unclassified Spirosoma]MBN8824670.1 hypothetical protein [Spirosoma sp.]OJW78780.1 MAG: hypothetical protein BGO59_09865 [Spirosoma sp. 48-14]